jgi:hypothetical protein
MTCQHVRDIFPDLLGSRLPDTGHPEARAHLAGCPDCQREFAALARTATALDTLPAPQPSTRLRANFYAMLEQEKQAAAMPSVAARPAEARATRRVSVWRWVLSPLLGCALIAAGFVIGQRSVPAPAVQIPIAKEDDSTKQELVALRDQINQQRQQLDKMTTLVGYSILQQQQNPANDRLRDVLVAARSENVNDKILDDLIQAVTLDPSANVRLRALEALYPHAERATVRAGVLAALPREQNPLVQLELIDFVAMARDQEATPLLERISANEAMNRTVRDAAKLALAQL